MVSAAEAAAAAAAATTWIRFAGKEYLFVMDASRQSDLGRDDAHATCRQLGAADLSSASSNEKTSGRTAATQASIAGLAAVENEDELEFVSEEIRRRVVEAGQEFAHEQWWTAGRSLAGRWIWDVVGHPTGASSPFAIRNVTSCSTESGGRSDRIQLSGGSGG